MIEHLQASLWQVPLVGLMVAVGLAVLTVWVDATTDLSLLEAVITSDAQAAREVLSVVATSMLTFTALVFTITIVVLQLASSQYSPRITRAFLRDRQTKLTLGLFIGTFAYSLLVLRSVRTVDDGFIPTLSVGVTYLLVFASLVTFIWYLDHVAQSIRVSQIVRRLAMQGVAMYENNLREYASAGGNETNVEEQPVARVLDWTGSPGVLGHIDEKRLAALAAKGRAIVRVRHAIGDFIPHGAPVLDVLGTDVDLRDHELCACVSIGADRTQQQDLGLPIRHLVDVALRALSPGVNDPTTAVQALDYVHDLLRRLAGSELPPHQVSGPDGQVRLIVQRVSWASLIGLAVTEIRLIAAHQIQVSRRVLSMLDDLLLIAPRERRPHLEQQRQLWIEATRDQYDALEDLAAAHQADSQGLGAGSH
ncbi:MAG TPA: DUF2254 domain-containing protein [Kofleriaceae bacterium]|nr:DUF2254 domain-containing protein [Kofleriaceae bacterium]